jgi:hypothetical protein
MTRCAVAIAVPHAAAWSCVDGGEGGYGALVTLRDDVDGNRARVSDGQREHARSGDHA